MGCNCGARGGRDKRTLYVLTTPDKRQHSYASKQEAEKVQGRKGGIIREVKA